jgi:shikimate kinase
MSADARRRRIIITGFMGAGKTTIARALAARLNCAMVDLDAAIVEQTRRSIEAIIDEDGEARFRHIEGEVLRECLAHGDARLIALGGGTWTLAENRAAIAAADCVTVWLDTPFELCWQRISNASHARPLARRREHALTLYTERRAAYELAALHIKVHEAQSAEDTAAEIMSRLEPE